MKKGLDVFSTISTEIFDKNALKKAIYSYDLTISLSLIRNRFLLNRSEENRKLFCKQRNKCVSFLGKSKKNYFANLNEKNITDKKGFWKTVKPFLSKQVHLPEIINLTKEENNYFYNKF